MKTFGFIIYLIETTYRFNKSHKGNSKIFDHKETDQLQFVVCKRNTDINFMLDTSHTELQNVLLMHDLIKLQKMFHTNFDVCKTTKIMNRSVFGDQLPFIFQCTSRCMYIHFNIKFNIAVVSNLKFKSIHLTISSPS